MSFIAVPNAAEQTIRFSACNTRQVGENPKVMTKTTNAVLDAREILTLVDLPLRSECWLNSQNDTPATIAQDLSLYLEQRDDR